MSQTRAFDLKAPSKFDSFKSKNPTIVPETSATTPGTSDNLLSEMAVDVKNSTSNGNHATIDFQGDFRPILMALCYYAASNYDALNVKQHSKVSPPTLVAYFLFVIYSYYLLCDLEIRPTPSSATRFVTTPEYIELKALMLSLPVPDFLLKFMQATAPTSDPRRPNISIVPTLACFYHAIDFGRIFPIGIFIQAHNFVISQRTNDAPEELMNKLMGIQVYSTERIGNYFGQLLSDGTTNYNYGHQLMQAFEGIVNPALARTRSQRIVYSRIHYFASPIDDVQSNGYLYAMNIEEQNVSETMTLIRQLQSTISSSFKITGTLSSVMSSLTGMNILIHGYSNFAVPTWHKSTVPENATDADLASAKIYASKIKLFSYTHSDPKHKLKFPSDNTTIEPSLYLVSQNKGAPMYPCHTDTVLYTGRNQSTPPIRILDPYDYNPTTFHNVFLSGALIESLELDSSIVPLPNTDTVLDEENTLFLQSAVPYPDVFKATNITYSDSTYHWFEKRTPIGQLGQPISLLLADSSLNRLARMNSSVFKAAPTTIPFFHILDNVTRWNSISNRIAYRVPNHEEKSNHRPDMFSTMSLMVWSPYRYYNGKVISSTIDNYYLITNLRTIFGTNPPLGEVSHFLEVMPIA
jgi:hypothetical protein